MSAKYIIAVAVIICTSWAQTNVTNVLDSVSLPSELKDKLDPKELEAAQNKTLSEIMTRCEKNGGPEAYNKAKNAGEELSQCVTRLANVSALQQEIEDAKPNGRVDEVFKKYCEKKPLFEVCVKNFTESSKACLSDKEQVHLKTVYNVTQQLAEFICFKEGDRIALFIAEGGQECFQDKQDGLRECVNNTMGVNAELDMNAVSNATLTFDKKQCKQILDLQTCVVGVLEKCPKPTSANIVESLFKFIRKATPCKKFVESPKASSAAGLFFTSATILAGLATTLLV